VADLARVRVWADALIALHLDPTWTFAFDRATTRAGLCDHRSQRISVSRHFAERFDDDEIHQVLLHEVAHALAGPKAGHGPRWKSVANDLGYVGKRLVDTPISSELAPWIGECPKGHQVYRYRRPSKTTSCARCSRSYDPAFALRWTKRVTQ
jgi:predicted SprT family Zn-dependent metalloprotease